jgi:hypothetical protein
MGPRLNPHPDRGPGPRSSTTTSEFLLTLPFNTTFSIEVAAMATDVAPSGIRGHVLRAESLEGITRGLILSGFIYARTLGGDGWTSC